MYRSPGKRSCSSATTRSASFVTERPLWCPVSMIQTQELSTFTTRYSACNRIALAYRVDVYEPDEPEALRDLPGGELVFMQVPKAAAAYAAAALRMVALAIACESDILVAHLGFEVLDVPSEPGPIYARRTHAALNLEHSG